MAVGQNQWYHVGVGAPPFLEPILVVGLGCALGVLCKLCGSPSRLFVRETGEVVLFAVPGAFTGVCSQGHVPSYLQRLEQLKAPNELRPSASSRDGNGGSRSGVLSRIAG